MVELNVTDQTAPPSRTRRIRWVKPTKEKMFWGWIAYQTIKGLLTTTFIWIPLWLSWTSGLPGF
jgi:hypothetical protein